jgi:predicted O-methyltransferase YrrM
MTTVNEELWSAVDEYITETLGLADPILDAALDAMADAGLPAISVAPNQGRLLQMLARMVHAARILEIGTLGGYSTIWMGRALASNGRLITLESNPKHAAVARANIARAGLDAKVQVRVGLALDTLPAFAKENQGPFDLIFIDADKANIPAYFEWALELSKSGSLIVVDNVVRDGGIIDAKSDDASVLGVRRLNEMLAGDRRVTATIIQTVGIKGYDGFTIALVN